MAWTYYITNKQFMETVRGDVMVSWSPLASCYVFECEWGCTGFDYESKQEAVEAYLAHHCVGQHIDSE